MSDYKNTPRQLKPRRSRLSFLAQPDGFIFVVVFLAFLVRIAMFFYLGSGATCDSDDVAYIESGIVFAKTGVVSVWTPYPTAKIMPGMPVVCGILSLIFGQGNAYIDSIRILWIILGSCTPYVLYKCCSVFLPKWYGVIAACWFLLPNWAWSDNAVLTEAPYLLFSMLAFYFMLKMGEEKCGSKKTVWAYVLSVMAGFMFRATMLIIIPFTLLYLLAFKKISFQNLKKPCLLMLAALLVFIIPWTVRNYIQFGEFIPVTDGATNPTLKGTYQGETAPADESLDYESNVLHVLMDEYPEYFNADGTLRDIADGEKMTEKYEALQTRYRLREWFRRDPLGLLKAYFISKPACVLDWVWIWLPLPKLYYSLRDLARVNLIVCFLGFILAFVFKKKRKITLFLSLYYWINIYILALSFISERYAAMYMPVRYMMFSITLYLIVDFIKGRRAKKQRPTECRQS
ncbi:MAG: ArnT family glycosyltransferase [Candidatus Limivicinus sp.]|jgi:hypothetical protein